MACKACFTLFFFYFGIAKWETMTKRERVTFWSFASILVKKRQNGARPLLFRNLGMRLLTCSF